MSTAAVMLVKDEADVIGYTVEHLLGQVDEVIVADNGSTDGTTEILAAYEDVLVLDDNEVGYWQSRKTSGLARLAGERGHVWAIPVDADEYWYAEDGRTLSAYLAGTAPDVGIVQARLYHHFPTVVDDPSEPNPFARIRHRLPEPSPLGKVACRITPGLVIQPGNHSADLGVPYLATTGGFAIRHFSWRSRDQYLRKITNGRAAYAATTLHESVGAHWRMFTDAPDEAIREHYDNVFLFDADRRAAELIEDPAPNYGSTI